MPMSGSRIVGMPFIHLKTSLGKDMTERIPATPLEVPVEPFELLRRHSWNAKRHGTVFEQNPQII